MRKGKGALETEKCSGISDPKRHERADRQGGWGQVRQNLAKFNKTPMTLFIVCLGGLRCAWVCWGPDLYSFSSSDSVSTFPSAHCSTNTWQLSHGQTWQMDCLGQTGKTGSRVCWATVVRLLVMSSTPEASKELSSYFFLLPRSCLSNRHWLLKLHELVNISKPL